MSRSPLPGSAAPPSVQETDSLAGSRRTAALFELARDNPEFARILSARLSRGAQREFLTALMAPCGPLRPIRKAMPRAHLESELSVQIRAYAKLVRR